ncbi:MAG TPA: NADH-quinone oxidoreductase subunit N [Bacteroidota bacterium]|nr:NADH-quinone oxidoreductase subunit N [Bacteroidota bacterium]
MVFSSSDIVGISPILAVSITALIALVIKSVYQKSEKLIAITSVCGLVVAIALSVWTFPLSSTAFSDMVLVGGYASFFDILFLTVGLLTILLSESYLQKVGLYYGEFYVLVLIAVVGMMLMGSSADLITVFLGVELMSVCFYILAGFMRTKESSNEAALKYFLLGAFATGFLLYGIALVYGTTGTTNLMRIAVEQGKGSVQAWYDIGFGLLLIGFAFKVAAVPFHMWAPDVYEGSPTTVSGLMSTGGKAAAFSAFILVFAIPLSQHDERFMLLLSLLAAASMLVGNLFGLAQTNLKRMLAYSSVAHAGYMLVGLASGQSLGEQGILFYLVSYAFTNLGAFGIIAILEKESGQNVSYENYAGLGSRRPWLAAALACFMFSLTGIPPFAGFVGKYYLFASAVEAHLTWLAIFGVATSLISAYYYLRVVVFMYFREAGDTEMIHVPALSIMSLGISVAGILLLGVLPSLVLNVTRLLF